MEEFIKYHKIKRLGDDENKDIFLNPDDEIVIEEKVDGANIRILIKDGKLIFGSRTQQLTSDEGEDIKIEKNFRRCIEFVRETLKDIDLKHFNNLILIGECMVRHTLSYDWDKMPPFLGFDIYNLETNEYVGYDGIVELFHLLRLPIVPLFKRCKASEITEINDDFVPISQYAPRENPNQKAEGLVFKNYKRQIFAKYVRSEFKEKNAEMFGKKSKGKSDDNNEEIVFKYCTNARIEKCIFKLIDMGENLEIKLMSKLPTIVYNDMMEEEWKEITNPKKRNKIDFYNLNKLITKRCLSVLEQVITNNNL